MGQNLQKANINHIDMNEKNWQNDLWYSQKMKTYGTPDLRVACDPVRPQWIAGKNPSFDTGLYLILGIYQKWFLCDSLETNVWIILCGFHHPNL